MANFDSADSSEREPVSFEEAFARLSSLTNYERLKPDPKYRLDLSGMKELCAALDDPQHRLGTVVQVGGSKGKGTVSSLLIGFARQAKLQVGGYFSPHVCDVLERVTWNGKPGKRADFAPSLAAATSNMHEGQTWFEVFTASAVHYFASKSPDLCVLEVGLGGRLDSTSVVPKQACCITGIELEHTQVLGDTIELIAREKAGILRESVPCVTGATGEALAVIKACATEVGAPLLVLGEDFDVRILSKGPQGMRISLDLGESGAQAPRELELCLFSRIQATSFALAAKLFSLTHPEQLVHILDSPGSERAGSERGAGETNLLDWPLAALPPARFQVLRADPPIIVDGSHTDTSLETLAADLAESFPGRRFQLVFGVASDKHWERGLGCLLPMVDRAFVAPLVGKESEDGATLVAFCRKAGVEGVCASSITEALRLAMAQQGDTGLLVTGSLYAAGEALTVIEA